MIQIEKKTSFLTLEGIGGVNLTPSNFLALNFCSLTDYQKVLAQLFFVC